MKNLENRVDEKIKWFDFIPVIGFSFYFGRNDLDRKGAFENTEKLLTYNTAIYLLATYFN